MSLKEFLIDWLTASRYVKWLEARHHEQRQDYTVRLAEKDEQIKQLRAEVTTLKLECDRMRAVQFHVPERPSKPPVLPAFSGPDDWQAELNKLYQQEEANGTHGDGRKEVYESSTDDGAQPDA